MYVDPNDDETVWMPVFELNVSRDGGRTFEEVNMRHVHNDLHSMWIDPNDSDHIVVKTAIVRGDRPGSGSPAGKATCNAAP